MLNIKSDKGAVSIDTTGAMVEIAADLGCAIASIYSQIKSADPETAETFRELLMITLLPGSPIWTEKGSFDPNAVTCIIPVKKKKGDPNND